MIVVLVIALLLLTAAVTVLYAMMGELSSRIASHDIEADSSIHDLPGARMGASIDVWPAGLAPLATMTHAVLVVLSPICKTCSHVAAELGQLPAGSLNECLGILISTGDKGVGQGFVESNALNQFPH